MIKKVLLITFIATICSVSCTKKHTVSISGSFENMPNEKIVIEKKTASRMLFLDSIQLNGNGKFSKNINILNDKEPSFISIKNQAGKQLLMLLTESGEKININYSKGNYTIDGSKGSTRIKELNDNLSKTFTSIDSLSKIINDEKTSETDFQSAQVAISKIFIDQKRYSIRFIIENPKSYASVFALYQQYPNGTKIFNTREDFLYYKVVLDSMDTRYRNAEYMTIIKRDFDEMQRTLELQNKFNNETIEEINYPDFELPDRNGKKIKLSSLQGKVILLVFWASIQDGNQFDNKLLSDIYEKYNSKGLEIYQVAFDTDRELWLRALNSQQLPWINVCDFKGRGSLPFGLYNVQKLPSNFIIDKDGQIIARDMFGDELEKKIRSLVNK
jgi:Peroxiredoxin